MSRLRKKTQSKEADPELVRLKPKRGRPRKHPAREYYTDAERAIIAEFLLSALVDADKTARRIQVSKILNDTKWAENTSAFWEGVGSYIAWLMPRVLHPKPVEKPEDYIKRMGIVVE